MLLYPRLGVGGIDTCPAIIHSEAGDTIIKALIIIEFLDSEGG